MLKQNKISPKKNLELSIRALSVYNIEPNIINDMLAKLEELTTEKKDCLDFSVWITGHDRETIEQMYRDWLS